MPRKKKIIEEPITMTEPENIKPEEPKEEAPVVYDDYRMFPVEVVIDGEKPRVIMDMRFIQTCHDFGRSLAFDGYDSTCAAPEAAEFIEKLVLPVNNKRDDNSSYSKDLIAKSFGLGFANYGFYYPERNLTLNDIDKLTQSITAHLEETRIL